MTSDLITAFDRYFELVHADTEALRGEVYRLRYQVYVLETGFEPAGVHTPDHGASAAADGQERDEYDARSDHYLIRHRRTGIHAATARLILPVAGRRADYPIERHCPLDAPVDAPRLRARLAEISRFAVSKVFKRRIGEAGTLAGVGPEVALYFAEDERRVLPHISLGLFAAVMRMVHAHGISHSYAVMEPALLRLLGRFGVIFNRIGPDVDYHGRRVPCLASVDEALPSIRRVAPSVWELITNRGEWQGGGAGTGQP